MFFFANKCMAEISTKLLGEKPGDVQLIGGHMQSNRSFQVSKIPSWIEQMCTSMPIILENTVWRGSTRKCVHSTSVQCRSKSSGCVQTKFSIYRTCTMYLKSINRGQRFLQRWYSNSSVLGTFPFWVFVTFPASALCVFRCFFCRVSRRHNGAVHPWTDLSLNSSLCELHSSADRNLLVVIGAFGLEREISTNKRRAFFRVDWNARIRNSSLSSEVLLCSESEMSYWHHFIRHFLPLPSPRWDACVQTTLRLPL